MKPVQTGSVKGIHVLQLSEGLLPSQDTLSTPAPGLDPTLQHIQRLTGNSGILLILSLPKTLS